MKLYLIGISALMCLFAGSVHAQSSSVFDGSWLAIVSCEAAREGAGYTLQFPASVRGGVLHGEFGTQSQANSLALDGKIQPDGNAMIQAQGMTGPIRYNVGRTPEGVPYHYNLQSKFQANRGTGTRLETRPCTATFTRM